MSDRMCTIQRHHTVICCLLWCSRYGDVSPSRRCRREPRVLVAQLPLDQDHSYFEMGNFYKHFLYILYHKCKGIHVTVSWSCIFLLQRLLYTWSKQYNSRSWLQNIFLNFLRLNVRKHSFSERIVTVWNNLECSVIDFSSVRHFKMSLFMCDLFKLHISNLALLLLLYCVLHCTEYFVAC